MITETQQEDVKYVPEKIKFTNYTCSDGKVFSSRWDEQAEGTVSAKQKAERHEKWLELKNEAKTKLKFYSITDGSEYNQGYECEFCFYYNPDLSEETKGWISVFVYPDCNENLDELVEGWYHVEQRIDNDGPQLAEINPFSEFIDYQERKLNAYKSIREELKSR